MILIDFIATQFFDARQNRLKKEDIAKLVESINGVLDVFKHALKNIETARNQRSPNIPIKVDNTFN